MGAVAEVAAHESAGVEGEGSLHPLHESDGHHQRRRRELGLLVEVVVEGGTGDEKEGDCGAIRTGEETNNLDPSTVETPANKLLLAVLSKEILSVSLYYGD